MSLKPHSIPPIPAQTVKVARAAFRKGNPYLQMRDTLGTFFTDDQFAQMYPADGQPAYAIIAVFTLLWALVLRWAWRQQVLMRCLGVDEDFRIAAQVPGTEKAND